MEIKKKEKVSDARYRLDIRIDADLLKKEYEKVENEFIKKLKLDGFRKGKVPREIAKQHIDPAHILNEAAFHLIQDHYGDILDKTKLRPIGDPKIEIKKIAIGDDLEFSIEMDVFPELHIADYEKIREKFSKREIPPVEVSEKELNDVILSFRKMRAQNEGADKSWNEISEEDLPDLDDGYVKKIGDFSSLDDFREKIRENIKKEKELKEFEKKRLELLDELIEGTEGEIPETLIQHELDKMLHEFEGNIVMTGVSFDDYLKSINKTKDDYRREWRDQAIKRVKTQLILDEIARKEKIEADREDIEREVQLLLERYKDHGIDENIVRSYVTQVLTHQKVFDFLEGKEDLKKSEKN